MSTIKSSDDHLTLSSDGSNKDIKFQANGVEKVIIKSDGNVGIGTTPQTELEISAAQSPFLRLTSEKDGNHDDGDVYGELQFYTQETYSNAPVVAAKIQAAHLRAGTGHSNGDMGLAFFTSTSSADATATERMRIDSYGNVGIGEQSVGAKLHVSHSDSSTDLTDANNIASFERNGNARLVIATNSANTGSLDFGDSGGARQGRVSYAHSNDSMQFFTSNTKHMQIDSTGAVTMPNQPAFGTRITSQMNNLVDGYNTITFDSEIFDQNSDFNTGTYKFTAPVTGKYMLSASIASMNLPLDAQWFFLQIITSNRSYTHSTSTDQFDAAADASHVTSYTMSSLADMDAGDTAYVRAYHYTGTNQTDINDNYSFFNGYLVC